MGWRKRPAQSPLLEIAARLAKEASALRFSEPVRYVYNPLEYAWELHQQYLLRFGNGQKEVLFLGMNPGPWGMAQTGVPFGEVAAVRDWMGIVGRVSTPDPMHPKRIVEGLDCARSEVSGARLWGWVQQHYKTPSAFFMKHFVINYCPLVFMEESARNYTPDKLRPEERQALAEVCDLALRQMIEYFEPRLIVGVGIYAEKQARRVAEGLEVQIGRVLHPSPASPIANRGWAPQAHAQLADLGAL